MIIMYMNAYYSNTKDILLCVTSEKVSYCDQRVVNQSQLHQYSDFPEAHLHFECPSLIPHLMKWGL